MKIILITSKLVVLTDDNEERVIMEVTRSNLNGMWYLDIKSKLE